MRQEEEFRIRQTVKATLDEYMPDYYRDLLIVCTDVERRLMELAREVSIEYLSKYYTDKGIEFVDSGVGRFRIGGQISVIDVHTRERSLHHVEISISCPGITNRNKYRTHSFSIDGGGQFNKASVTNCIDIDVPSDEIGEIFTSVFEYGYLWLNQYVRAFVANLQRGVVEHLYTHLRSILPEKYHYEVYLYIVNKKNGVYVMDQLMVDHAIRKAKSHGGFDGTSPLYKVADFSITTLDRNKLFSPKAHILDQSIVSELGKAKYVDSGFNISEEAIIQVGAMITQPLAREWDILLSAGYRPEIRSVVEPILESNRAEFRQIISSGHDRINRAVEKINMKSTVAQYNTKIAELTGTLIGSIVKVIIKQS
jgi:hypothetical protein